MERSGSGKREASRRVGDALCVDTRLRQRLDGGQERRKGGFWGRGLMQQEGMVMWRSKCFGFGGVGVCPGVGMQVVDSPLLMQQIEAQRLSIKHLKNENNRFKVL